MKARGIEETFNGLLMLLFRLKGRDEDVFIEIAAYDCNPLSIRVTNGHISKPLFKHVLILRDIYEEEGTFLILLVSYLACQKFPRNVQVSLCVNTVVYVGYIGLHSKIIA